MVDYNGKHRYDLRRRIFLFHACVGLRRENMLSVLQWLDAEKNPYILMTGTERS